MKNYSETPITRANFKAVCRRHKVSVQMYEEIFDERRHNVDYFLYVNKNYIYDTQKTRDLFKL